MDINDMRIAVTVASLALFIALVAHTWSRSRRAEHDAAALLPFVEDDSTVPGQNRGENK
jgi:cytochrome c oxidase cbb3-type subunit 4